MAKRTTKPANSNELDGKEFFAAIAQIEQEKGIKPGYMMEKITQALLSAIPVPERHSKRKKIILQGDLPSPANPPSGCIFHTRCFMAQEICSTQKPELRDIGGGHLSACHFCNGACAQNGTTEDK